MKSYMKKFDNMKKYILPLLFLIMTFIMIPKGAYYKKENIDITILTSGGDWQGYLQIIHPLNYRMEKNWIELKGNREIKETIKNTISNEYIFHLNKGDEKIEEITFSTNTKKISFKNIEERKNRILKKDLEKLYSLNVINLVLYAFLSIFLLWHFFKNGIEFKSQNIGLFMIALVLMSICLNLKWLSKVNGIFLSVTLIKVFLHGKKIKFGYFELVGITLLVLSLLSEYFNFLNYEKTYTYFQNTILVLIAMKIWNFDYFEKQILKNLFKISLILLSVVNFMSPLVMGGGYAFTFGVLMTILIADCTEELVFNYRHKLNTIINFLILPLGFYGLVVSGRRTMMVAIILYYLYIFIKLINKKNKKMIVFLLATGMLTFATMGIIFKNEISKAKELVISITNTKTNQSNIQRLLMWRRGYYVGLENPLLGIGVNGFYKEIIKEKYDHIKNKKEKFEPVFIHVHNEYIHQIITRGIFGAILFYGIWIYILSKLSKSEDKDFDIMLLIIYGVYGMFDPYSIRSESIVFYVFMGISFTNCLPKDTKENKIIEKIGYLSTISIFLIGLYFNKRFRYYFFIILFLYLIYYFYQRKRVKNEKI